MRHYWEGEGLLTLVLRMSLPEPTGPPETPENSLGVVLLVNL